VTLRRSLSTGRERRGSGGVEVHVENAD
jgi:hypothetical protein